MNDLQSLLSASDLEINLELFKRRDFDFICINEQGELQKKHLKQEEALFVLTDNQTAEFVYGGAAGGAKTWTGCAWLIFSCLSYAETKWFIGRDDRTKLKETTLLTFHRVCKAYGLLRDKDYWYLEKGHCIMFDNGSRIDLLELKYYPTADPLFERFGSLEYTGGWIEEGGEVHFGAFDTLKSRVGRMHNDKYGLIRKLYVTCNPKKNWLYTHFYKPSLKGILKAYQKFVQALVSDNPFIESGYVEGLKSMSDVARKERLLNGNWDYDDDPAALMTFEKISDVFTAEHVKKTGTRYITADIARLGKDWTRIYIWDGMVNIRRVYLHKKKLDEIEAEIRKLATEYKVPMSRVVVDSDGLGASVPDHLKCQEFQNNSAPFENLDTGQKETGKYENKRSQLYFKAAQIINDAGMYIEHCEGEEQEDISLELSVIKKKDLDGDGKDGVISRKDIIDLIGSSPDHATNIMLRMFFLYKIVKAPKYSF